MRIGMTVNFMIPPNPSPRSPIKDDRVRWPHEAGCGPSPRCERGDGDAPSESNSSPDRQAKRRTSKDNGRIVLGDIYHPWNIGQDLYIAVIRHDVDIRI